MCIEKSWRRVSQVRYEMNQEEENDSFEFNMPTGCYKNLKKPVWYVKIDENIERKTNANKRKTFSGHDERDKR